MKNFFLLSLFSVYAGLFGSQHGQAVVSFTVLNTRVVQLDNEIASLRQNSSLRTLEKIQLLERDIPARLKLFKDQFQAAQETYKNEQVRSLVFNLGIAFGPPVLLSGVYRLTRYLQEIVPTDNEALLVLLASFSFGYLAYQRIAPRNLDAIEVQKNLITKIKEVDHAIRHELAFFKSIQEMKKLSEECNLLPRIMGHSFSSRTI